VTRRGGSGEAIQPGNATAARQDPQADLRQAEPGRGGRDPDVRRERQFEAAAETPAADGGNDRDRQCIETLVKDRNGFREVH